ncbi:hypothetical protein MLD38_035503 [Melastoma candidum]|uniref:Uncharacterized protein n=1 Tax=Melastoma candidum TaxID=119954 RepID=A0ACB9LGT4_9MYRT|nr:hypothetical protein MLD38_035503 [Melastoma candidum]
MIAESTLNVKDGRAVDKYINSTKNATAVIYKTTSAKRPNIAALGLDILAGYSKLSSVTGDPTDTRHTTFNIFSGTSMACPHVAAAAAYVKSFRPSWSPAAIKSSLMTTATPMRIDDGLHELSAGSDQINPVKAVHPGLVYDITYSSYLSFLCKEGYNSTDIGILTGSKKKFNWSSMKPAKGMDGLN